MLNPITPGPSRTTIEELILAGFVLHALKVRRDVDVSVPLDSGRGSNQAALAATAFGKQFEIVVRERTRALRV